MNIGIFVSPRHSVPSRDDQRSVAWDTAGQLADGLANKGGHKVFLFAASNSTTTARLLHFDIAALDSARESLSPSSYRQHVAASEEALFKGMMEIAVSEHLDVIHIYEPNESLADLVRQTPHTQPFVCTIHDPILSNRLEGLEALGALERCFLVSISNAQRDGFRTIPFAETIYYGVTVGDFPVGAGGDGQIMVAGRISAEKGFEDAIATASHSGDTLVIAGKVYQSLLGTNSYFREKIEPRLYDAKLIMKQLLSQSELAAFYGSSRAFLYPTKWDEPFAMVMLEAMACGTPVVGYNRGCVPEVVVDGVTGFIVDPDGSDRPGIGSFIVKKQGVEGLVEAMGRIKDIKRSDCRQRVEEKFSIAKMVDDYEHLYTKILGKK